MALNKIKLNSIPQRNKDVVFGFTREQENVSNNNFIMPQMIKYLCLLYLNQNKDEFDVDNNDKDIKLNGNCVSTIHSMAHTIISSCLLQNQVHQRKHIWKFKINKYNYQSTAIGIHNAKFEFTRDKFFDIDENYNCPGYAMSFGGKKTDISSHNAWGKSTGLQFKKGDIIDIILDFNEMKLYGKKGDECVELFDIEKGTYRAAVTLRGDCSISLLSYQELY
eukprot:530479_1